MSGVEVGVEVICHSTLRIRYPFKKRIHVKNAQSLTPNCLPSLFFVCKTDLVWKLSYKHWYMGSSTETVAFQVYEILKINHEFLQFFWLGSLSRKVIHTHKIKLKSWILGSQVVRILEDYATEDSDCVSYSHCWNSSSRITEFSCDQKCASVLHYVKWFVQWQTIREKQWRLLKNFGQF